MTKKSVLLLGFVGTLLVSSMFIFGSHACYVNNACNRIGDFINQDNLTVIFALPVIFLFSLITFKMREEVFRAWWNFARWFAPVIMLITFILNYAGNGSGMGGAIGKGFDMFVLGLLYVILVVVSAVQIIRTHRNLSKAGL